MTSLWTHASLFKDGNTTDGPRDRALTVGEGGTPLEACPALAARCGVRDLLLKREDCNPSGSHKDRGLLYQVARHAPQGGVTFVLSSSGNAAVSAAVACQATGNRLVAFVAPSTAPAKLSRLLASDAFVVVCSKPINFARFASRVFGLRDLRGTKDPVATVGYRSIAGEVAAEAPEAGALFTFSSSGVSMTGIADGYDQLASSPALWSVQSGACVGIVRALWPDTPSDPDSPAGRLGIRNPPGAETLARRLTASGGGALAISAEDVRCWQQHLRDAGVKTSAEGAAVLAGISVTPGLENQQVVAVLTGRAQSIVAEAPTAEEPLRPESYLDVRRLLIEQVGLEPVA